MSDPTQTLNTMDVTLWEIKNERNAWPGSNPKRTAFSILRKKYWTTVEVM